MLKIIVIVLAFAIYGASTLIDQFFATAPQAQTAETSSPAGASAFNLTGLRGAAANAGLSAVGLQARAMPSSGCQPGIITIEQLQALVNQAPAGAQQLLTNIFNAAPINMAPQVYAGDLGAGLCFPGLQQLLLFPVTD